MTFGRVTHRPVPHVVVVTVGSVVVVVVGGTVVVVVGGTVVVVVVVGGTVVVVVGGTVVVVVVVVGGGGSVVGTVGRVVVVTIGGGEVGGGGAGGKRATTGLSSMEKDDDKGSAVSVRFRAFRASCAALARLFAALALPASCFALGPWTWGVEPVEPLGLIPLNVKELGSVVVVESCTLMVPEAMAL